MREGEERHIHLQSTLVGYQRENDNPQTQSADFKEKDGYIDGEDEVATNGTGSV